MSIDIGKITQGSEQAIVATQGVVQEISGKMELGEARKSEAHDPTKSAETLLKRAIAGEKGKDLGTEILKNVAAMVQQGNVQEGLLNRLLNKEKHEGKITGEDAEPSENDNVEISASLRKILGDTPGQGKERGGFSFGRSPSSPEQEEVADDIRSYRDALTENVIKGGNKSQEKIRLMERKLAEDGLSKQDIGQIRQQVMKTVRTELTRQIKDAFLNKVLTKEGTFEFAAQEKQLNDLLSLATQNEKLYSSWDIGKHSFLLRNTTERLVKEAGQDIKEFVEDELHQVVVRKGLGQEDKTMEKEVEGLLKLGEKVGLDIPTFMRKIPKVMDDQGLVPHLRFVDVGVGAPGGGSMGDQQTPQRHGYELTTEDEKQILTDRMRLLAMQRALHGDSRMDLGISFKMIKTRNGLIRLGLRNDELDKIMQQGRGLARVKLMEMLKEGFQERATMSELAGPAWQVTEKKIKVVMSNMERLGIHFTDRDVNQLRDQSNLQMYDEAKHELSLVQAAIAHWDIPYYRQKEKILKDVLGRLQEETPILQTFKTPVEEIPNSQSLIREAA